MNKLSLASLAAIAACSGAPVIQQSAPEVGTRQALTALQATQEGLQNNGDFIWCIDDYTTRTIKDGLISAGKTTSFLLEDETKHFALLAAGEDACSAARYNIARRIQECLLGYNEATLKRERRSPSIFSIPIYCDGMDDKPTHTCNASITIEDIGRNNAKDDVCVRMNIEETKLIPTPQTPLPEAP